MRKPSRLLRVTDFHVLCQQELVARFQIGAWIYGDGGIGRITLGLGRPEQSGSNLACAVVADGIANVDIAQKAEGLGELEHTATPQRQLDIRRAQFTVYRNIKAPYDGPPELIRGPVRNGADLIQHPV
jgi:hypothetical protein